MVHALLLVKPLSRSDEMAGQEIETSTAERELDLSID